MVKTSFRFFFFCFNFLNFLIFRTVLQAHSFHHGYSEYFLFLPYYFTLLIAQVHDQAAHRVGISKTHIRDPISAASASPAAAPCDEEKCRSPAVFKCASCQQQYCKVGLSYLLLITIRLCSSFLITFLKLLYLLAACRSTIRWLIPSETTRNIFAMTLP